MSLSKFLGWTLGTAVATPLAPLGLIYYFTHKVYQSGNGADAWMTFAIGMGSVLGCVVLAASTLAALANPVVAAVLYAVWCLAVGIKIGLAK